MIRSILLLLIAAAAPAAVAAGQVSGDTASALVKETIRLIRQNYVFAEKADAITGHLEKQLAAGRYAAAEGQELATKVTEDMQGVTSDKHMSVKFNPEQAANLRRPQGPGSAGFGAQQMAATNYGVPELKVLPGNIRYMNISPALFWDPNRSPQVFDDAMRFLGGGDAYIIDIRTNGGGSPTTVRYIVSHFMKPGEKLMTFRMGPSGTSESRTGAVPAGQLPENPLYVLTSPKSASAAEEFASHIKNFKLGKLVGATTAGAGHRNSLFGTPDGFVISISVGTAIHPVTNTGWEGTGVTPDIAVPVEEALSAAHADALQGLIASAAEPRKSQLQKVLDGLSKKE